MSSRVILYSSLQNEPSRLGHGALRHRHVWFLSRYQHLQCLEGTATRWLYYRRSRGELSCRIFITVVEKYLQIWSIHPLVMRIIKSPSLTQFLSSFENGFQPLSTVQYQNVVQNVITHLVFLKFVQYFKGIYTLITQQIPPAASIDIPRLLYCRRPCARHMCYY